MADPNAMPYLGDGQLGAALQAIQNRPGQIDAGVNAALGTGAPPLAQALGGALQAGANPAAGMRGAYAAPRPMVSPQQQQQLIMLLRARAAAQQAQQQGVPPSAAIPQTPPPVNPGAVAYAPQPGVQ